jgi:hypothetical protein
VFESEIVGGIVDLHFITSIPIQFLKALFPITVTELPIVTDNKESKLHAKYAGIRCTLSPIFIVAMGQL